MLIYLLNISHSFHGISRYLNLVVRDKKRAYTLSYFVKYTNVYASILEERL